MKPRSVATLTLMLSAWLHQAGPVLADAFSDALESTGIDWSVVAAADPRSSWQVATATDGDDAVISSIGPRAVPGPGPFGFIYLGDTSKLTGSFTGPGVVSYEYDWRYNSGNFSGAFSVEPAGASRYSVYPVRHFSAFGPGSHEVIFNHRTDNGETHYATATVNRVSFQPSPGLAPNAALDLPGIEMTATPAGSWVGAGTEIAATPATDRLVLLPNTPRPAQLTVNLTGPAFVSVDHTRGTNGHGWGHWWIGSTAVETVYPGEPGQGYSTRFSFVVPPGTHAVSYHHEGIPSTSMSLDQMTVAPGNVAFDAALDTPGRTWTSLAVYPFAGIAGTDAYSGGDYIAGSSGGLTSTISTQVTGPAEVAFAYKGAGIAQIDGTERKRFQSFAYSGTGLVLNGWTMESVLVPAGTHTVSFSAVDYYSQYQDLYLDAMVIEPLLDSTALATALDMPGRDWRSSAGWQQISTGPAVGSTCLNITAPGGGALVNEYVELDVPGPVAVTFRYQVAGAGALLSVNGTTLPPGAGGWQIGTFITGPNEPAVRISSAGTTTGMKLDGIEIHGIVSQREGMDLPLRLPFGAGGFPFSDAVGGDIAVIRSGLSLAESPLPCRLSFRYRALHASSGTVDVLFRNNVISTFTLSNNWQTFTADLPDGNVYLSNYTGSEVFALDDLRITPGIAGNYSITAVYPGIPGTWLQNAAAPWTANGEVLSSAGSASYLLGMIPGPATISATLASPTGSNNLYATVELDGASLDTGDIGNQGGTFRACVGPGTHYLAFSGSNLRLSALSIRAGDTSGLTPVMGDVIACGMLGGTLTTEDGRTVINGPAALLRSSASSTVGFSFVPNWTTVSFNGQTFGGTSGVWKDAAVHATNGLLTGSLRSGQRAAGFFDIPVSNMVPVPGHESWSSPPGAWRAYSPSALRAVNPGAVAERTLVGPGTLRLDPGTYGGLEVSLNGQPFVSLVECWASFPSGTHVVRIRSEEPVSYSFNPQSTSAAETLDADVPFLYSVDGYGNFYFRTGPAVDNDFLEFLPSGTLIFTASEPGIFSIRAKGGVTPEIFPRPLAGWNPQSAGGLGWRDLAIPVSPGTVVSIGLFYNPQGGSSQAVDALRFTPAPPGYLDSVGGDLTTFTSQNLHPADDRDLDGASNLLEYICGTDAANPSERTGGTQFFSQNGQLYMECQIHGSLPTAAILLQRSADLSVWSNESTAAFSRTPMAGSSIETWRWDLPPGRVRQYYRIARP